MKETAGGIVAVVVAHVDNAAATHVMALRLVRMVPWTVDECSNSRQYVKFINLFFI